MSHPIINIDRLPTFKDIEKLKYLVFDLDDTLYHKDTLLYIQIEKSITEYITTYLHMDQNEAYEKQMFFYKHYGSTLRGLMYETDVDAEDFVNVVHERIDLSVVPENTPLKNALEKIPLKKYVFTNGAREHGQRVCKKLGIYDCFNGYFGAQNTNYIPKPNPEAFYYLFEDFNLNPKQALFFEDNRKNLETGKNLGFKTVWIVNDPKDISGDYKKEDYIDYVTTDITQWIEHLCGLYKE